MGIHCIGFTGIDGGEMNDLCHVLIKAPSADTARIQETHILIGHVLCEIIEQAMAD